MPRKRREPKGRRAPEVPDEVRSFLVEGKGRIPMIFRADEGALHRAWRAIGPGVVRDWKAGLLPHLGARGPWALRWDLGYAGGI